MDMTKPWLILIACFLVTFVAGIGTGVAAARFIAGSYRASLLARTLELTPQQQERMAQIWSGVRAPSPRQRREQLLVLQKERDEAIRGLLSDEQKLGFDQVMQTYADKSAALDRESEKAFDEAVARTKQMLTESQRDKYEQFLKSRPRPWHGRPGPPGMGPTDREAEKRRDEAE